MREIQCVKSVRIRSYSGPFFPAFGLKYAVFLRTRKSVLLLAKKISWILLEFPYLVPAKINHYQINFHQINSSNKFLSKRLCLLIKGELLIHQIKILLTCQIKLCLCAFIMSHTRLARIFALQLPECQVIPCLKQARCKI